MTVKQKAARENFKKAVRDAQKLRKENPKLTQAQALKAAFSKNKKVGAVKKSASKKVVAKKCAPKKAAAKKVTSTHKDTQSHNVNIRVVSGTNRDFKPNYLDPKSVLNEILFFQNLVTKNNEKLKKEKNIKIKAALRYEIANNKKWIATNTKQLKELLNKLK